MSGTLNRGSFAALPVSVGYFSERRGEIGGVKRVGEKKERRGEKREGGRKMIE
jgi:hypothetical protein